MWRKSPGPIRAGSSTCAATAMGVLLLATAITDGASTQRGKACVPLVYCTDLFHPPDDPDDWFDLATAFAIEEFDIRGIVLDQGLRQSQKPGRIPMEQMRAITHRKVPYACGLSRKLKTPCDKATDQPDEFQGGVELILRILKNTEGKVALITVGSLRDVCAAFNRAPELVRAKIERLYVNAGDSGGGLEYNVRLDPNAYIGVMRSGLPIYWLPCFGKQPFVSRWQFRQGDLLDSCPVEVQNFFAYGLMRGKAGKEDPIAALARPLAEDVKKKVWDMNRSMWSTASFLHAAGRTLARKDGEWRAVPASEGRGENPVFEFVPARVRVSDGGITRSEDIEVNSPGFDLRIFRSKVTVNDYSLAMRQSLEGVLHNLSP